MIEDITPGWREVGKIKAGVEDGDHPSVLETWRLTTRYRDLADTAAAAFGGVVTPDGAGWQVITSTGDLPILLPPQDIAAGQWWELWGGGGLLRRCTGTAIVQTDQTDPAGYRKIGPCLCDEENAPRACKPTTVLRVIIPELPEVGLWRFTTRSIHAARELPATADILWRLSRAPYAAAFLTLERRHTKKTGQPGRRFTVPILRLRQSSADELALTDEEAPALDPPEAHQDPQDGRKSLPPPPPSPAVPPEWEALNRLLLDHPPSSATAIEDPAALTETLLTLEALMLEVGLWRRSSSGALPLDVSAARLIDDHDGLWRTVQITTTRLKAFAVRALAAADTAFVAAPLGLRVRRSTGPPGPADPLH